MKVVNTSRVRPKSTHRKQRAAELQRTKLAPVQGRSKKRHEEILVAVERLLEEVNIEDLSHSDIAREAGISKPSVHYHFPTIAALQRELGRRCDARLYHVLLDHSKQFISASVTSWQEWLRLGAVVARDYFNTNRAACEALYGPMLHRENRIAGFEYNSQVGMAMLKMIQDRFVFDAYPELDSIFSINGEIIDLFWGASYLRKGFIDDDAFEESLRASRGYLRHYLPEVLPLRKAKIDSSVVTA